MENITTASKIQRSTLEDGLDKIRTVLCTIEDQIECLGEKLTPLLRTEETLSDKTNAPEECPETPAIMFDLQRIRQRIETQCSTLALLSQRLVL